MMLLERQQQRRQAFPEDSESCCGAARFQLLEVELLQDERLRLWERGEGQGRQQGEHLLPFSLRNKPL